MVTGEEAKLFCRRFRLNRAGIRNSVQMASVCLICGSIHVAAVAGSVPTAMKCRNCGFEFVRYSCWNCGAPVDGRDPGNPACRECGWRVCTCTACSPAGCSGQRQGLHEAAGLG